MKVLVILSALTTLVASAKLGHLEHSASTGYHYPEPEIPSGLYEIPADPTTTTTSTTTTTTTTPPPPPPAAYLPPVDEEPSGNEPAVDIIQLDVPELDEPKPKMLMPYDINWGVEDAETGNSFAHVEESDGRDVSGQYSVLLPDGRTQIVKFRSSPETGYIAEVSYA